MERKALIGLAVVAAVILVVWAVKEPSSGSSDALYVRGDIVNVRAGASTDADIVAKVKRGEELRSIGKVGDWVQVTLPNGRTGFVQASLVGSQEKTSKASMASNEPAANAQPAPPSVATVPAPSANAAKPAAEKDWEIVSVDSKVTESNTVWWRYAWKLTLRNKGTVPRAFSATIEFQDKDGFIIDTSRSGTFVVQPNDDDTATGYALITTPGASNVARTVAKVGVVR